MQRNLRVIPISKPPIHPPGEGAQVVAKTVSGTPGKIMIVDDHPDTLHLLDHLLQVKGHRVFAFLDASAAFEAIRDILPDLLILDIRMPRVDGFTFCRSIRADPLLRDTPVLFLSALHTKENIVGAFECGGRDYLSKPFHAAELYARVDVHLENTFLRAQMAQKQKRLEALVARLREEVATRRECQAQLQVMADTDALTGLFNRRVFMDLLPREVARAKRHQTSLSLLMIDVDHFKRINDTLGHAQGDDCLRKLAATLSASLRESDVAARLGGEEFATLLPHTCLDGAKGIAHRILQAVRNQSLHCARHNIKVTVSIGAAELPSSATTADDLLRQADQAMYKAKNQGRDQVCLCCTEPSAHNR